jgi:RNA-dependent RNA polymerase
MPDSLSTLHQPIYTYQHPTSPPSFYSHLNPEIGDMPENDDTMYRQHSRGHRRGGGGRGWYPSNSLSDNPANSTGARNAGLPIVKPATASLSPPSRTVSGQERNQAPLPPTRSSNLPIVRSTSASQKLQYKPAMNGYAKQNYANQRNNGKTAGPPSYNNRSGSQGFHQQQRSPNKSLTRGNNNNWAYHQELKIKIFGLPRGCWTQNVYEGLSKYGRVVRIEMQAGSMDCNAWVTFQYVFSIQQRTMLIGVI